MKYSSSTGNDEIKDVPEIGEALSMAEKTFYSRSIHYGGDNVNREASSWP